MSREFDSLVAGLIEDVLGGPGIFPDDARIVCGSRSQRDPPKELQRRLTSLGGRNIYGQPRLRLIWGWTPTDYIYNRKEQCYELRPRYVTKKDRWHVEQWFPAEHYGTPDFWRWQYTVALEGKQIDLLGPYPERGGYEHLVTVERPHKKTCEQEGFDDPCACGGGYVELTPEVCDDLVNFLRMGKDVSPSQRRADVWTKIQDHYDKDDPEVDAMISDVMPAFGSRQHVVIPHKWKGEN